MTLNIINYPVQFDAAEAGRLLEDTAGISDTGKRIERISEHLRGREYVEGSLGGGPRLPEELRISLSAFDCVTFIESVLGLAMAGTIAEAIDLIRRIRYQDGEVDWFNRNHYMVDWARNNEECGFIKNLTSGPQATRKTCTLGLIEGLTEKVVAFTYFPTQNRDKVTGLFETGDLLLFVSTKETLDVFHTGFLIEREGRWLLRHATRTAGAVIDQEFVEFTVQNSMAGFVLLRPICQR